MTIWMRFVAASCLAPFLCCWAVEPETDAAGELAKKLANPISSLTSLPLQYNYDEGYGVDGDGLVGRLNVQPVIPFSISEDWNLITRTILPLVDQEDIPVNGAGESGLGDVTASLFFSPKQPTARGLIWGAGPVALIPTASEDVLGGEQWGIGPTVVMLKQEGPWTAGFLGNQIWSVAGEDDRADVNATFLQPFLSSIFQKTKTTVGLNTESTYDWGGRGLVRSGERIDRAIIQGRTADHAAYVGRPLLGGVAGRRPGGLGRARTIDVPFPKIRTAPGWDQGPIAEFSGDT